MRIFGKKGFTLLELLVVISIIGILIAMGAVAYSTAQKKGRDARRTGDMKAMQNAFEQYYAANNSQYATACSTMWSTLPQDPKTTGWTPYTTGSGCSTTASYCVCAKLESGNGGNSSDASCSPSNNGGFFCIQNLQ